MSKKEIEFSTPNEAIAYVDKAYQEKGKSKPRPRKAPKTNGTEIKAVNSVPSDDYRANYSAIFGHD